MPYDFTKKRLNESHRTEIVHSSKKPNLVLISIISFISIVCFVIIFVTIANKNTNKVLDEMRISQELSSATLSTEYDSVWNNISNMDESLPSEPTNSSSPIPSSSNTPFPTSTPVHTAVSSTDVPNPTAAIENESVSLTLPVATPTTVPTAIPTPVPTSVPTQIPTSIPTNTPIITPLSVPSGYHYEYYKSLLASDMQEDYTRLYSGIYNFSSEIAVHSSGEYLGSLYDAVHNDHPELFWLDNQMSAHSSNKSSDLFIVPSYLFGTSDSIPCQNKIDSIAQSITSSCAGQSNYQKIKAVYEYLISSTVYGDCAYDQTCYSLFMNNKSVCVGYSSAFKLLMDRLEIPCIIVTGENNSHVWNMVYLDDNWYHVDVTWGDPVCSDGKQRIYYDYFLLSDKEILKDHTFDQQYPYPSAPITCVQKTQDNLKKRLT